MKAYHPFNVEFPAHDKALRQRALKLTGDPQRADDLVQDTFLRAWRYRDRFEPETKLRAWLYKIMHNIFIDQSRKYWREIEDIEGKLASSAFVAPRHDQAIEVKEILAAIRILPVKQRKPLILMALAGYSQLEAAEACACSVGTIKSRVSRARTSLLNLAGMEPISDINRLV